MTRQQLVAQALVSWLRRTLPSVADTARESLPHMDLAYFFRGLAGLQDFHPEEWSIALADFEAGETQLRELAEAAGLKLCAVTDDLHVAASWRNARENHPHILAFARGLHPGVNTLRHFEEPHSQDLARALLEWAKGESIFCINAAQRDLLEVLGSGPFNELLSLEASSRFLEVWSVLRGSDPDTAPSRALPMLGLLADPDLLVRTDGIEARLTKNRELTRQIMDASAHHLRSLRKTIKGRLRNDVQTRGKLLDALTHIEGLRLKPTFENRSSITYDEASEVWRPPVDLPNPQEEEEIGGSHDEVPESIGLQEIAGFTGEFLLDDCQEKLETLLEDLEQNLNEALESTESVPESEVRLGDFTRDLDLAIDRPFLDWLHTFCTEEAWGGLIESQEPELSKALGNYAGSKHHFTEPAGIYKTSELLSLERLLRDWDNDLSKRGHVTRLAPLWQTLVELRGRILPELDLIVHFPLTWLAGKPAMAEVVAQYLDTAAKLYQQIQQYYKEAADVDVGWARAVLEGVLSLDVVQVRTQLADDRCSFKALMLPTHPLHLWRYQRLAAVLRGLGPSLSEEDRRAVLNECRRPEQFLSVLFAGSLISGRGGNRLLPISNDLYGLATFENLQNAYVGLDGLNIINYTLDRFTVINRNHTTPLRVAIINPPQARTLIAALTKLLADRRATTVRRLRVELFATAQPSVRSRAGKALEFSGKEQEIIEDRLTGGRLELRVHEKPCAIEDLVSKLSERPFHVVVIFDEAGVSIRRHGMLERLLPMSPFCVRKTIRYDEHHNNLRLVPSNDDAPFTDFMQLVNEAESGQRDSTPQTWADAENLRQIIDDVLQGERPGAAWLVVADRALPSESGMKSVRLLMRREGQRDLLVLTRDYRRLANRVRPAFDKSNLQVSSTQLDELLEDGVNLVGAGLLDLLKHDGSPDANRVRGLAGILLAARDYRRRHPHSLIVSVDNLVARLWLRLGQRGERCDLLCLRHEAGKFIIEALEVKTTAAAVESSDNTLVNEAQVQIAATLEAVAQGLPSENRESPLSAPRCEMLKEVFVRGCLSRSVPAQQRSRWSQWLKDLFRQEGKATPYELRGEVVRIAIHSSRTQPVQLISPQPFPIYLRRLNEADVQRLVERYSEANPGGEPHYTAEPEEQQREEAPQEVVTAPQTSSPGKAHETSAPRPTEVVRVSAPAEETTFPWPPVVNEFGMIGQTQVVRQLLNQINYAHDFGERFSDKLFVGTAGVGKSSLARAIADRLIGEQIIQFNGSDLQKPRMFIERLQQARKVPSRPRGRVLIESCVIFIDEVHAIHGSVVTTLLGALDDARLTTVDNVEYDFSKVVLLMATTDPGRLPEAFRSRPGRVQLSNYTLDEMAGILWKHGQDVLEGFELPRSVCLEIAARLRCRPREAVRMLTENLIQHFHGLAREAGKRASRHLIGEMMTLEEVSSFFDDQGLDLNGIDQIGRNYLLYLNRNGATAEERLRQALGIPNRNDFIEVDEYLQRLGLVTIQGGRALTSQGRRYVQSGPFDLRTRIARQIG